MDQPKEAAREAGASANTVYKINMLIRMRLADIGYYRFDTPIMAWIRSRERLRLAFTNSLNGFLTQRKFRPYGSEERSEEKSWERHYHALEIIHVFTWAITDPMNEFNTQALFADIKKIVKATGPLNTRPPEDQIEQEMARTKRMHSARIERLNLESLESKIEYMARHSDRIEIATGTLLLK
ncbi:MAG: hypothetical protein ACFCUR_07495 [Rhodomicrobiaceae bacterium]